jgi:hypothetical protein
MGLVINAQFSNEAKGKTLGFFLWAKAKET